MLLLLASFDFNYETSCTENTPYFHFQNNQQKIKGGKMCKLRAKQTFLSKFVIPCWNFAALLEFVRLCHWRCGVVSENIDKIQKKTKKPETITTWQNSEDPAYIKNIQRNLTGFENVFQLR